MSAITVVLAFACTFTTCALVAAICTGADLEKRLEDERIESAGLRRLVRKVVQFERAGCEGCSHWDSCDADTLYRETAKRFGYKTLSPKARQRLEGVRRF